MKTIQVDIPENMYNNAKELVAKGWFQDENQIFAEAIRRFLEAHQPELMELLIREDAQWGLHGED